MINTGKSKLKEKATYLRFKKKSPMTISKYVKNAFNKLPTPIHNKISLQTGKRSGTL